MRDGVLLSLPISQLVVGDVVRLQAGERVPADGVLLTGQVYVDQSALNGESKEVKKQPPAPASTRWDLSNRQLFSRQHHHLRRRRDAGRARRQPDLYGDMARQMQEETRESPLKVRLNGLTRVISRLGYLAAILVFAADFFLSVWTEGGMQLSGIWPVLTNFPVMLGHH